MNYRSFLKSYLLPLPLMWCLFNLIGCSSKGLASSNSSSDASRLTVVPEPSRGGIYVGTLPCADCEGIETELILHSSTYQLSSTYLNKKDEPFKESGPYTWNPKDRIISLDNGRQFQVEKGKLYLLNLKGQRIEGPLAGRYILTQKEYPSLDSLEANLALNSWLLIQLGGNPIDSVGLTETPFLVFLPGEKKIHGKTSCNSFFGHYDLKSPTNLNLSGLGTTKRYCQNMWVENQFVQALSSTALFQLEGDLLIFRDPANNEIARFKKAPPK